MKITDQITAYRYICPNKVAIQSSYKHLTYHELDISTNQIANGLLNQSLHPGDKVGILLNNCTEFLQIFIGVSKAGLTPVPLDSKWSAKEIQSVQKECRFSMIFVEECHLHR